MIEYGACLMDLVSESRSWQVLGGGLLGNANILPMVRPTRGWGGPRRLNNLKVKLDYINSIFLTKNLDIQKLYEKYYKLQL